MIEGTASAKVAPIGGTGSYHFADLTAACLGTGTSPQFETAVLVLGISSNGTFSNTICGTGTWDSSTARGTAISVKSIPSGDPDDLAGDLAGANLNYHIDFTAGVGSLHWTASTTTGGGVVDITPDPAQPGVLDGNCIDGFQVAGEVSLNI